MPLRTGTEMLDLGGATEWINGETNADALRGGGPTLIHFWAVSCYICKDHMSTLRQWKTTYGGQGLKLVAVHAPRGADDTDTVKVKEAVAALGVDEPCAVDNDHALVERYQLGGLWPHYFLFDAEGKLRGRSAGKADLSLMEGALKRLLEPPAPAA